MVVVLMGLALFFIRPMGARETTIGTRARSAISRATRASFASATAAVSEERIGGTSVGRGGERTATGSLFSSGGMTKVVRGGVVSGKDESNGSLAVAEVVGGKTDIAVVAVLVVAAIVFPAVKNAKNPFLLGAPPPVDAVSGIDVGVDVSTGASVDEGTDEGKGSEADDA